MPRGLHYVVPVNPNPPYYLHPPLIPTHEVWSSLKTPYCLCTKYLLTQSVPIIYHPICKPISAYFFIKSTFFQFVTVISCSILTTDRKNFSYILLIKTFTDGLSTLCRVCREGEKKERAEGLILHFYQKRLLESEESMIASHNSTSLSKTFC